jgi:hypothetical protein
MALVYAKFAKFANSLLWIFTVIAAICKIYARMTTHGKWKMVAHMNLLDYWNMKI